MAIRLYTMFPYRLALVFVVLVPILSTYGQIDPPIPILPTTPGIILGNGSPTAQVKLEVFIELLCPDSKAAWAIIKDLEAAYQPHELVIVVTQFTLPYHRNAYVVNQGYNFISDQYPAQVLNYMEGIFENIARFSASNTREMNDLQVLDDLAAVQQDYTGVDAQVFKDGVGGYATETVRQWKYGSRRAVAGTPWYFINGVDLAYNPVSAIPFDDLKAFIDSLLASA